MVQANCEYMLIRSSNVWYLVYREVYGRLNQPVLDI